ncbi:MAG: aminopeptidase, partial [Candidatus Eremiobacteraeota bacterium]|nr:aminopeptidase [Candidatus Eremiobacteraeota bacterium]
MSCSEEKLNSSIRKALKECLAVTPGENLLVIADTVTEKIGRGFWNIGKELGAESMLMMLFPRKNHGEEPPPAVASAMKNADIFVAPTSKSLTHTKAREEATKAGARGATLPSVTEDIICRAIDVNYEEMEKLVMKLVDLLSKGKQVQLTSASGTNITFSIDGRSGEPDTGIYRKPGEFGNLPAGEAYIAPVEETANGIFIVDGAMAGSNGLAESIRVEVVDGYATKITGGDAAKNLESALEKHGKLARNIAEFGIGTNPSARIIYNVLEDEKVMGTVHIALGNNLHFGGKVDVPLHLDGIITSPSFSIDGIEVMKDG